ncbi:MAG TPA: hypothetical protein VD995_03100 [Azospirillum sp.]|nr:hypothetical protein [Azospirillum sp.]
MSDQLAKLRASTTGAAIVAQVAPSPRLKVITSRYGTVHIVMKPDEDNRARIDMTPREAFLMGLLLVLHAFRARRAAWRHRKWRA